MGLSGRFGRGETFPSDPLKQARRAEAFRWLAALFFWSLVLFCALASLRGAALCSKTVSYLRGNALTPSEADARQRASEFARAFAAEWATFDATSSEGQQEYEARLASFGVEHAPSPASGRQECSFASVVGADKAEGGIYRVLVCLHVRRLATNPQAGAAVSSTPTEGQAAFIYAQVSVEVPKGEPPRLVGLPVPAHPPAVRWQDPASLLGNEQAPPDFSTFAQQALALYFQGGDMTNFVAPGTIVKAAGGWKLENLEIRSFSPSGDRAAALVEAEVSSTGVERFPVSLVLRAVKKDRWLLESVGSW